MLAGGPARAAATTPSARAGLVPAPGEWWFGRWHVQQEVWPLTEGAGGTVAGPDTGVQASLPDLRGEDFRAVLDLGLEARADRLPRGNRIAQRAERNDDVE